MFFACDLTVLSLQRSFNNQNEKLKRLEETRISKEKDVSQSKEEGEMSEVARRLAEVEKKYKNLTSELYERESEWRVKEMENIALRERDTLSLKELRDKEVAVSHSLYTPLSVSPMSH